jgi:hypothetical protein
MRMMSENFSKCPKGLRQNLTIGLNLKFPAKTLYGICQDDVTVISVTKILWYKLQPSQTAVHNIY